MKTTNYPSDLTEAQFGRIAALLPHAKQGGRPRSVNLHDVVNAILYVNRTGCQWRALPDDYPPWSTAYHYFRLWRRDGTWQRVNDTLRAQVRQRAGRKRSPRTAYIDSQSVKAGGSGGDKGFDAAKKIAGRKRHILVDSLGLVLAIWVTAACVPDAHAASDLIGCLPMDQLTRLHIIWADTAYATTALLEDVAFWGYRLLFVRRPADAKGWVHLPKRWVVERTFGWLLRFRRHSRDYERETASSEAMVYVSMIYVMVHRLEPEAAWHRFQYRKAS
jgi:putative transposase